MFSNMNQHKFLDMIKLQESFKDCLKIVIAEAGVSDTASTVSFEKEPNVVFRNLMNKSRPIEVTKNCAHYEIVFDDYIAYAVTNESYAGNIDEIYGGRLARVYSKSAFLNYISQGTFATKEYPGPFVHYGFCCLNQIIDVVSEKPPQIKLLKIQNDYV